MCKERFLLRLFVVFTSSSTYLSSIAIRYHPIIETVQPPNLWQPSTSFISNVTRPFPAQLQQQTPASSLSSSTNTNAMYLTTNQPNDVIDLSLPFSSTNNYYSSDRTHPSPSGTAYPPLFNYVPPSFNHHHHHHHHHLTSTMDDNSLLIQNPSLT
jgi:hypothetical protein